MIPDDCKELTHTEYLALLEKVMKLTKERRRSCMCPGCSNDAIFSHVFQRRNQQLAEITTNGKVLAFTYNHLFAFLRSEPLLGYKELGVSKQFGFPGFCNTHDTALFAPIERSDSIVDWYDERNQYLLAYRTLCREIYTNNVMYEFASDILHRCVFGENGLFLAYKKIQADCSYSLHIMNKYKTLLEKGIFSSDYSSYYFKVVQLPFRLELCLAAPIVIRDECKGPYFGPDKDKIVDPINIIEIFPSNGKTIILIGYLDGAPNSWAGEIFGNLQTEEIEDISWALQDILFRAEFHCISKELYDEVSEDIPLFLEEWYKQKDNLCSNMTYTSGIFRKPILRQLGYKDE